MAVTHPDVVLVVAPDQVFGVGMLHSVWNVEATRVFIYEGKASEMPAVFILFDHFNFF
jgi:hypothetical protein